MLASRLSAPLPKVSLSSATSSQIVKDTTVEAIITEIQSDKWESEIAAVREAIAHRESIRLTATEDEQKAAEAMVKKLKTQLPAVLWSGKFTKRNNESIQEFSGYLCADVDKVPDRVQELMEIARQDPHVVAAFISPSGTGVKIVFQVPVPSDDLGHKRNFAAVRSQVSTQYHAQVDEAAKDVARLCFVSHDPDAFYNAAATELEVRTERTERMEPEKPTDKRQIPPNRDAGPVKEGNRNNATFKFACECRDKGMTLEEAMEVARDFAARCEPPFDEKEAETCVRSAYSREPRSRNGIRDEYLGADTSALPPKSSEEAKASLLERLVARMYSPTVKPEEPAPRFSLGGVDICTPGNLTAIGGPPKAAKSAIVTAMIASTFADPSADCLGARSLNSHGHAVIHIDTEQCPYDHWVGVQRTIRRAKVDGAPEWLQSYCLTGFPTQDVRGAIRLLIEEGHRRFGGVHSAFIDGVADAAFDVNDPAEANSLVAELHGLAIEFNCPIIGIIHLNPGSESKTRGHLGSQLERKAETNLRLEKDAEGVTLVWADKNRRAPISKDNAPRFAWSDEVGMHASKQSVRQVKDEALKPSLRGLAERVFSDAQKAGLTHTALVNQYRASTGVSETTAKTKIKEMVELGVVVKGLDKIYSLKK